MGDTSEPFDWWNSASDDWREQAELAAEDTPDPIIPDLGYTESNTHWILLYMHAQRGQIRPEALRRMSDSDLKYLAGIHIGHPDFFEPQRPDSPTTGGGESDQAYRERIGRGVKVAENVTRARQELERRAEDRRAEQLRRATIRAGVLAGGAAIIAAALAAAASIGFTGRSDGGSTPVTVIVQAPTTTTSSSTPPSTAAASTTSTP